ncbi:MAG: redoxin domain-containing protein [Bacillota bacterium]
MAKRTTTIAAVLAVAIAAVGAVQFFGARRPQPEAPVTPGAPVGPATPTSPATPTVPPQQAAEPALAVGDRAPDFTLPNASGKEFSLSQYLGKENVLLFFHMGTG